MDRPAMIRRRDAETRRAAMEEAAKIVGNLGDDAVCRAIMRAIRAAASPASAGEDKTKEAGDEPAPCSPE